MRQRSWYASEHRESVLRTNLNDNSSAGVLHCGILPRPTTAWGQGLPLRLRWRRDSYTPRKLPSLGCAQTRGHLFLDDQQAVSAFRTKSSGTFIHELFMCCALQHMEPFGCCGAILWQPRKGERPWL